MGRKKLAIAYLRSVSGLFAAGAFWFAIGWGLSSVALGALLLFWSVALGPLAVPAATWIWMRARGNLSRLDLAKDPLLSRECFASLLARPGPRPRVWVRPSVDTSLLWFENPFPGSSRQEIVVTSAWMSRPSATRAADWRALWETIASAGRRERTLRTWQIGFWTGALSPLDFFLLILHFITEICGLSDLPGPGFWFQRIAWSLRQRWFGLAPDPGELRRPERSQSLREPSVWHSLSWGVWFQIPLREAHPLWLLMLHRSAFLEERPLQPSVHPV